VWTALHVVQVTDNVKTQLEAEMAELSARIAALQAQVNAADDELRILWGVADELNAQQRYQQTNQTLYQQCLQVAHQG
jgi:hypothetical protein